MQNLTFLILIPVLLLNFLGGLIGGVGLAFEGEWGLVAGGIGYGLVGPFLISLAMAPLMLLMPLVTKAFEQGHTARAFIAGLPNIIWTYVLVAASCLFVFSTIVTEGNSSFFALLWAYSVAIAPWTFLAKKDQQSGNDQSSTLIAFVQFGLIAAMVATWLKPNETGVERLAYWFLPFMALGIAAQVLIAWELVRRTKRGF